MKDSTTGIETVQNKILRLRRNGAEKTTPYEVMATEGQSERPRNCKRYQGRLRTIGGDKQIGSHTHVTPPLFSPLQKGTNGQTNSFHTTHPKLQNVSVVLSVLQL